MALYTELERDGQPLPVEGGWSFWHLNRMADAMQEETGGDDFYPSSDDGTYTFKCDHTFRSPEYEIWARGFTPGAIYIWEIKAGDKYKVWRR